MAEKKDETQLVPAIKFDDDPPDDFDRANPRSLINLLPTWIRDAVNGIPQRFFEFSEIELQNFIFGEKVEADSTSHRIRIAFWDEYDRCQRFGDKKMQVYNITEGICTPAFFKRLVTVQPKLAWIIHPPAQYEISLKEIHELGLRQARAAMALSIINNKGEPNVKLIEAQTKITQHIDMRIKGAIIQRIDQRNINAHGTLTDLAKLDGGRIANKSDDRKPLTMDEIEARIAAAKAESTRLLTPGSVTVDMMKIIRSPASQLEKALAESQRPLMEADLEADIIESDETSPDTEPSGTLG